MESNDNNNYLFELIQDLQTKLSDESTHDTKENKNNSQYIQESMFNNDSKKTDKNDSNLNLSNILDNLNLSSIFGKDSSGIDMNTINKAQKIMSAMSKEDPRKNLLNSLKPFLSKSRQDKLNEYLTYLTIGSALGLFDDKGSGKNGTQ